MIVDPSLYIPLLMAGAFVAALAIGAIGFADALILNSVWLHIMEPNFAIPLVVSCAFLMHAVPIYKLHNVLNFSRLKPFIFGGVLGVPIGALALRYIEPDLFRSAIAVLLIVYGLWMLVRPGNLVGEAGGRNVDGLVGLSGGFMGGFAGLSGLAPTLWVGMRGWPREVQRGVYQPFVLVMHGLSIAAFATSGLITSRTGYDLLWCLPAIVLGSWLGVKIYPFLNDLIFRRIILGLILVSGITLLI